MRTGRILTKNFNLKYSPKYSGVNLEEVRCQNKGFIALEKMTKRNSQSQNFPKFRGIFNPSQENDVVRDENGEIAKKFETKVGRRIGDP